MLACSLPSWLYAVPVWTPTSRNFPLPTFSKSMFGLESQATKISGLPSRLKSTVTGIKQKYPGGGAVPEDSETSRREPSPLLRNRIFSERFRPIGLHCTFTPFHVFCGPEPCSNVFASC